ncbi:RT0821/Lpp0805 family surface protein [Roseibium sp.]|uniref:RT0821/Lpp0805 family surface protein n=1 Tax=Roseibium sp. TaxID=1936156 RepID=UPI003D0C4630
MIFSVIAVSGCTGVTPREATATASVPSTAQLNYSDKSLASSNLQAALEKSLSGRSLRWKNPASGVSGMVTPLKTWKTVQGTYCRSYNEKIKLASGELLDRRGVACRSSEAIWKSA